MDLTKSYKAGVCACCGNTGVEIQSAHKRGFERSELVKQFFRASTLEKTDDICTVDMDMFEQKFIEFSSDISNFHFLCEKCHKLYDDGLIAEDSFKYKNESIKEPRRKKRA